MSPLARRVYLRDYNEARRRSLFRQPWYTRLWRWIWS